MTESDVKRKRKKEKENENEKEKNKNKKTRLAKVKTSKQVQDEWPTYTIEGHTGTVAPKILERV